jgi:hypothetical protein
MYHKATLDQDDVYTLSSGNADDDDNGLPLWGWDEDW